MMNIGSEALVSFISRMICSWIAPLVSMPKLILVSCVLSVEIRSLEKVLLAKSALGESRIIGRPQALKSLATVVILRRAWLVGSSP